MVKVTLLTHTQEPEKLVAAAAKLCYSSSNIDGLMESLDSGPESKTERFLSMLTEIGHESPIEHVTFTFGIEGVSRSLLAQITRHRIASFSVQSQRYVKENDFSFVVPPEIETDSEAKRIYLASMEQIHQSYLKLSEILADKYYQKLSAKGIPEKQAHASAEKQAIEDARFVLPNACKTKMIVTMNARSLNNFFRLRCCNRAQWEIRDVATQMLHLVREAAPVLFRYSGPPCLSGNCTEGKMSCGNQEEVRKRFTII